VDTILEQKNLEIRKLVLVLMEKSQQTEYEKNISINQLPTKKESEWHLLLDIQFNYFHYSFILSL
jgi:hypothetical protein